MYVFLVILFSVKNCREHATIHLLHFSISWDGFENRMKTFLPDSSTSLRDLGHFSRYLESVLHSPQQQCLVLTILRRFWVQTSHFKRFFQTFAGKKNWVCLMCESCEPCEPCEPCESHCEPCDSCEPGCEPCESPF